MDAICDVLKWRAQSKLPKQTKQWYWLLITNWLILSCLITYILQKLKKVEKMLNAYSELYAYSELCSTRPTTSTYYIYYKTTST